MSETNSSRGYTPLISYSTRVTVETINFATLSFIICFFGIGANIVNIIIFYKQGLDKTTNINFFGLAISDLFNLIFIQWVNLCFNPLFANSKIIPLDAPMVQYLTGSWPHACFGHITCWITAYITAERCLCIALPLTVKRIITPRRTAIVLCVIYAFNFMSFAPDYSFSYIDWKFFPDRNRSLLTLYIGDAKPEVKGLSFILLVVLGSASFPAVVIFTIILLTKLKQQAKWRQRTVNDTKRNDAITKRDIKTMNMVLLISTILIVCYTPGIAGAAATFCDPSFSIKGVHVNAMLVYFSFVFLGSAVNSSVNIFLYYKMSTKFRTIFQEMFGLCYRSKQDTTAIKANSEVPEHSRETV